MTARMRCVWRNVVQRICIEEHQVDTLASADFTGVGLRKKLRGVDRCGAQCLRRGEAGADERCKFFVHAESRMHDAERCILERVARPFPIEPIRTLDAVHLATAELLGEPPQLVTIVTRDVRVRGNARALGYAVE
jgi:hypothetical protein